MLLETVQKYNAQMVNFEPFFRHPIGHCKTSFCKFSMLKHICFANEKKKAEKHRMIS